MIEQIKRFRIPLLTGVAVVVVALVAYVVWISPEGNKLSGLRTHETQLQGQQAQLQGELTTLKREKSQLSANCQVLNRDLTEVPGTPSVDKFLQQVTALAVSSGDPNTPTISVTQATTPSPTTGPTTTTTVPRASGGSAGKGASGPGSSVSTVQVTLTLAGTYGQMSSFISGLDGFPRLFTISTIALTGGPVANGGGSVPGSTPGYKLALTGSIYYSNGQQNACTAKTA